MQITFNIPTAKVSRVVDAMKGLSPIPTIPDPDFDGDEADAPQIPEFTDGAWAKECMRRWIRNQVARFEQSEAKKAIKFTPDDDIAS